MPKSTLSPQALAELFALRDAVQQAGHGQKQPLIAEFAQLRGISPHTAYRWLADFGGYRPERKTRTDAGSTRLPDETLNFIAANVNEGVRKTGSSTKPICVAMNIAHVNGLTVNVSESRIGALMRMHRMDVKTQSNARNHQKMRSLYPNHVHQIDPSLCLIYYMGGKQYMMREEEFNKNKPVAMDKVKLKVWRYTRYDHASRTVDVRYYEAAGENQLSLFDFLLHTWGRCESRLSHGVPEILLWDKGSANTSRGIRSLLDALKVQHETHATHHAWVKGGVESANWLVERHFESRLKDEPVQSIEQLNASAQGWVRDYNANCITHVDCRVHSDDGLAHVRDDLWSLIAHHPHALREMPGREVCAYFMRGKEETRKVTNSYITFVHPLVGSSRPYNLGQHAHDLANGDTVRVIPMLMGDNSIRVEFDRYGQEPLRFEVTADAEFDAYGRPMTATLIGEERKQAQHSAATIAAKTLAKTAYGEDASLEDAEALRNKNARPFAHMNEGKGLVAHSQLGKTEQPTRLLPKADEALVVDLQRQVQPLAAQLLTYFEVMQQLAREGCKLDAAAFARLKADYPGGSVPEDAVQQIKARALAIAGSGLSVVAGGAR